ncbi:MAG: hypothetical protein LHV69_09540 [Elusimicrobia bacterium]|nr:hypothetical protein [Candidatus Obscuribacterium magneticum]
MRGPIKGALYGELQNSLRMKKAYEKELRELPQGSLSVKEIRGNEYAYLARRKGGKVEFEYKGKISEEERKKYQEAKEIRARDRTLLARVKKQIKYLKGALRGKEPI